MHESVGQLAMLRRNLASIAGGRLLSSDKRVSTGHPSLDTTLDGGLARGRLHELFAAEIEDGPSAMGLAAMLALRAVGRQGPIFWLRTDLAQRHEGSIYAPGLVELGIEPDALVLGQAPDNKTLLKCAADAARCPGIKALVVECWGKCPELDLTASRRLALATEQSGAALFLLRLDAHPVPSAADTRWSVSAAPSRALEANAPGPPTLEIKLLRRRAGPSGMRWCLEWDRDQIIFREPAHIGAVVSLPAGRSAEADSGLRLSA